MEYYRSEAIAVGNSCIFAASKSKNMDKLKKCIWIVNTVAAAGDAGITLTELNRKWTADPEKDPIPYRTFLRLRDYIANVFGIDIDCDKRYNAYYIPYRDELYDDRLKMWLLNSFAMHSRLSGDLELRRRVRFEEIPGGNRWLDPIMEAMQQFSKISFLYQKEYETEKTSYPNCAPLALKLFKQRWYLIADKGVGEIRFFALDRITEVKSLDVKFQIPSDFDLDDLFQDAFGMYVNPEIATERIVVKADRGQSLYLMSLPLHHSQQIIETTDDYSIFSWRLKPTYDFIQQLLTMNLHIEVLEPLSLRTKIAELLKSMAKKHNSSPTPHSSRKLVTKATKNSMKENN